MRIGLGKYFMTGKVTMSATPVAVFPSSLNLRGGLLIKPDSGNTGIIYVGDSGVTFNNGYPMQANQETFLRVDDVSGVFMIANVASQKAAWFAV